MQTHHLAGNVLSTLDRHIRQALKAAGLDTAGNPNFAKDYGSYLERLGFRQISQSSPSEAGDIAVIQPTPAAAKDGLSPDAGHIAAYDGHQWVSDFFQHHGSNDYYGGSYRNDRPPVTFYRYCGPDAYHHAQSPDGRLKPICPHCTSLLQIEQDRDDPKADDPVSCSFHGFIGTRSEVEMAVLECARTHMSDEIKVELG